MSESIVVTALPGAGAHPLPDAPIKRGQTLLRDAMAAYVVAKPARDRSRAARLHWWDERLGHVPLAELDSDVISDLLDTYQSGAALKYKRGVGFVEGLPRSNGTVNRLRSALGGLLVWCKKRRLTPKDWTNPIPNTEHRKEAMGRIRFLTEKEASDLLACTKASSFSRLYLLCLFYIHSGARKGELLRLRGRDLDLERGLAHLPMTKNGEEADLVMTADVVAEIKRVGIPKDDELLFPSSRLKGKAPIDPAKAFARAVKDAGLAVERREGESAEEFAARRSRDKVTIHTLRHTHASRMVQKSVSLPRVQQSMRHKSLAMTMRYAHLDPSEKVDATRSVFGSGAR
jgi:integrase